MVVWDDVRKHKDVGPALFLRIMDRFPVRVQRKGGYINWRPRLLVFTYLYEPRDFFGNGWPGEVTGQFLRRIDEIIYFHNFVKTIIKS